jgi:hypothetical protein
MITIEEFKKNSNSSFRKNCFSMRQKIILQPGFQFICIIIIGFMVLLAPMISIVIIYNKFNAN